MSDSSVPVCIIGHHSVRAAYQRRSSLCLLTVFTVRVWCSRDTLLAAVSGPALRASSSRGKPEWLKLSHDKMEWGLKSGSRRSSRSLPRWRDGKKTSHGTQTGQNSLPICGSQTALHRDRNRGTGSRGGEPQCPVLCTPTLCLRYPNSAPVPSQVVEGPLKGYSLHFFL